MSDVATGSTVPRRQLGRYLKDLRLQARLPARAAAEKLEMSESRLWRIETGQVGLRSLDVEAMCRLYGAADSLTDDLKALAKETKAKGWWLSYGDVISEDLDLYIGLEGAASRLDWYESELVPGLLQTADYYRTLYRFERPDVDEAELDRRIQLRLARQNLLTRVTDPAELNIVISEAVLRRYVGGAGVMAGQLGHLAEMARLPNVSLKVTPFSSGLHLGVLSGSFEILRFPANGTGAATEPPIVYVDAYTGALYLEKPHELDKYQRAFDAIWKGSLSEAKSKAMMAALAKELAP